MVSTDRGHDAMVTCFIRYEIDPFKVAAYERYRARLRDDPQGRSNYEFARKGQFIRREDRLFLRLVSTPHAELVRP